MDGVVVREAKNTCDEVGVDSNEGMRGPDNETEETCGPDDEKGVCVTRVRCLEHQMEDAEKSATIGVVSVTRGARDVERVTEKSRGSDGVGASSAGSEMLEIAGVTICSSMSWATRSPMLTSKSWLLRLKSSTRTMLR